MVAGVRRVEKLGSVDLPWLGAGLDGMADTTSNRFDEVIEGKHALLRDQRFGLVDCVPDRCPIGESRAGGGVEERSVGAANSDHEQALEYN